MPPPTLMQRITKRTFGGAVLVVAATVGACALFGPRKPPVYAPFTTPAGVWVKDLVVPERTAPIAPGSPVVLHCRIELEDGTVIDDTEETGRPLEFVFGREEELALPPGFAEGLEGLRDRGRRTMRVPPELGFGAEGVPGLVPPDATLVITVEVLEVGEPVPPAGGGAASAGGAGG